MPETAAVLDATPAEQATTPSVQRVSPSDALKMVRLRAEGLTFDQIAQATGWSAGTVYHYATQADSVEASRKLLNHKALRAAEVVSDQLEHTNPKVSQGAARITLSAAGVLSAPQVQQAVGVSIIIGMPGQPAGIDPFEAKVVVITDTSEPSNEQVPSNQGVA